MQTNKAYKQRLLQYCKTLIQERIDTAQAAMDNAQQASNSEEKSSAGDKYETARAMGHIEKDMHAKQLEANKIELAALSIVENSNNETAGTGAFIDCGQQLFFIAAGLGKITFEGKTIFVLSPKAPLAKLFFSKKKGDKIIFNSTEIIIADIF